MNKKSLLQMKIYKFLEGVIPALEGVIPALERKKAQIARIIEKIKILTKYNLQYTVQLNEQFVTVGFVTEVRAESPIEW